MSEYVENGTNVPVIDIPVEGSTEIVPVDNGELQEVTPMQMAVGGILTMAIGYGVGKFVEVVVHKWVNPLVTSWAEKIEAKKKKDALEPAPAAAENADDPEKRIRKAIKGMKRR